MFKKIININGENFILNKIKHKSLEPDVEYWKKITRSDEIAEDKNNYYFISKIEDAIIIPELLTAKK
ncbi:MAG: hypothetical protein H8E98_03015 [Bacteroidetes bacterium]|nr:hypothetical protein [Bacteroidota bacterium]